MTFARPTLSEIVTRVRGDIESRLPGADGALRHSVLDVLARAHGGASAGLYGYLDWLSRQLMPDTAEGEHLARWAAIWGIRRKAATPARVTATATGTSGATIPAGAQALRIDGAAYRVVQESVLANGAAALVLEAVATGAAGALRPGAQLTFANALLGVHAQVTVTAATDPGSEEEADESLLARLLARIQQPPQGGAAHDYKAWTLAQPGVTRAWAWPRWMGVGTVGVSFVMDGRPNILPQPADLAAVAAALDLLRPVTAEVVVFAPTPFPIDLVIRLIPDNPANRTAAGAELADLFARDAEPGGTIYLSRVAEAISLSAGEFAHHLEIPDRDVTAPAGHMPVLGSVTFV